MVCSKLLSITWRRESQWSTIKAKKKLTIAQQSAGDTWDHDHREPIHKVSCYFCPLPSSSNTQNIPRGKKIHLVHIIFGSLGLQVVSIRDPTETSNPNHRWSWKPASQPASQPALMIKLLLQESKTSMKKLIILWESIQNNGYNRWVLLSFRPNSCSQNAKPRRPGSHEKWMWNMSSEVYGITGKSPHYKGIKSVDRNQK